MAGHAADRLEPGDHGLDVDLQRPGQGRGRQGVTHLARADQPEIHRHVPVEPVEHEPGAGGVDPFDPRRDVHLGGMLHAEAHPAGVQVHATQDLGVRVVGVDHRRAPGDDLADELRLGPPVPQRDLGGQSIGHAHVGDHGRLERDALEAAGLDGLAGRLDHARVAVHVDHVREDRGQPRRPAGPGPAERAGGFRGGTAGPGPGPIPAPRGRFAIPSDQPRAPIRPHRRPAASRIDRTNRLVTVLPKVPVTPTVVSRSDGSPARAWQIFAWAAPGVVDDHLEPAGLGAGVLQHHAGGAPVERLTDEGVAVVARVADRDEHLTRVESAMVVGAAGDLPVGATHEPGLGEQPPEAHRGNPLLRQTVSEPACHRHTPPCFASQPCSVSFLVPAPRPVPGVNPFPPAVASRVPLGIRPLFQGPGSPGPGDWHRRPSVTRVDVELDPISDFLSFSHHVRPVRGPVGGGYVASRRCVACRWRHFRQTGEKGNPNGPPGR